MIDAEDMPEPKWYFGAYDKGLRHPGCLQIWAVNDQRMYRVLEIYKTGETSDWWAEQVMAANEDFPLSALVCDPSEPEYIKVFNDRLGAGEVGTAAASRAKPRTRSAPASTWSAGACPAWTTDPASTSAAAAA